jgi:hypothetical protein
LLNSHIARSCVPVVLAHLSEFQLVLTSHVESYPTSCLLSRPGDYASHESISFTTGKYNQVKYICFPIRDCHHCDILRHALLGAFQTCQPVLALLLGLSAVANAGSFAELLGGTHPHLMVYQPQRHTRRADRKGCMQLHPILRWIV